MPEQPDGNLIIIGGHEAKQGDSTILQEVAKQALDGNGALTIVTVATQLPEEVGAEYQAVFKRLGVKRIEILDIRTRAGLSRGQRREDRQRRCDLLHRR